MDLSGIEAIVTFLVQVPIGRGAAAAATCSGLLGLAAAIGCIWMFSTPTILCVCMFVNSKNIGVCVCVYVCMCVFVCVCGGRPGGGCWLRCRTQTLTLSRALSLTLSHTNLVGDLAPALVLVFARGLFNRGLFNRGLLAVVIYIYMHICVCVCAHVYVHAYNTHTHTHTHTHTNTHTHTCMHVCMYVCMQ
jgi:hypothetical protein